MWQFWRSLSKKKSIQMQNLFRFMHVLLYSAFISTMNYSSTKTPSRTTIQHLLFTPGTARSVFVVSRYMRSDMHLMMKTIYR